MSKKLLIGVALLLFLVSVGVSYAYFRFLSPTKAHLNTPTPTPNLKDSLELLPTPLPSDPATKLWSIVLLGYGGAGHQGGYLTDVIQQVIVWPDKQLVATIHLPRDLMVEYPLNSGKYRKINSLFATKTKPENYPKDKVTTQEASSGAQLVKAYVGMVTGITPQAFIGIDFNSFVKAIDNLGGITVNVSQPFTDPWYPVTGRELELCGLTPEAVTAMSATMSGFLLEKQFPCRYETLSFSSGPTLFKGETALKYVRSRHSSSDFQRGKRQAEVLSAGLTKLIDLHQTSRWPVIYDTVKKAVVTDIGTTLEAEWLATIPNLGGYTKIILGLDTTNGLVNKSVNGASGLIPQTETGSWEAIHQLIQSKLKGNP